MHSTNTCRIYIVRHGETVWNVEGKLQGQADTPLTKKGVVQARERANELSRIEFEAIFASDLGRTMRTAEILKADRELVVMATTMMRERAFGRYEGTTYEEFRREMAAKLAERDMLGMEAQAGFRLSEDVETDEEIVGRGLLFIRETALAYPGKTVLMVSHGGMMRALLWKLGVTSHDGKKIGMGIISNLAYFVLKTDGVEMEVVEMEGIEFEELRQEKIEDVRDNGSEKSANG